MQVLSTQQDYREQDWQRNENDTSFHLISTDAFVGPAPDSLWQALLKETHLKVLFTAPNEERIGLLPLCSSLRSLAVFLLPVLKITSLSELLLQAPFIHSISFYLSPTDNISSLPLSHLKSFIISGSSSESISEALIKSKPKSLTHLDLSNFSGSFEPLASALLECPSLSNLTLHERQRFDRNILPLIQVLPRLPLLTTLSLELSSFADESVEGLLSCLPQSAVQDLKLGVLTPKQLQSLARALPSLSSLQSLEFSCPSSDYESAHLDLFSSLASSSLRSLTLTNSFFRRVALEACLDKVPLSQLTRLLFLSLTTSAVATTYDRSNRKSQSDFADDFFDWGTRFANINDRFCLISRD
jgi:hypothetical protein